MKDGAHTHGHHSGGGSLALAAIVAVLVLASGLAETLARVLPILITSVAVIAGLWIVGWVTRAVLTYRSQHAYPDVTGTAPPDQLTDADRAGREIVTLRQAVAELHAQLAAARALPPPAARHEHLHFHGLAAEQVAAILAARPPTRPDDGGER